MRTFRSVNLTSSVPTAPPVERRFVHPPRRSVRPRPVRDRSRQVVGVAEEFDRGDAAVGDGEGEHDLRFAAMRPHRPARPSTSVSLAACARPENVSATAAAPDTTAASPRATTASSARSTTLRIEHSSNASKSPPRDAARNALTISFCRLASASGRFRRTLHPPSRPARELPRGRRRLARRSARCRRTAPRTCRAARTPAARPASASPVRRAARARPNPPAPLRARDRVRRRRRARGSARRPAARAARAAAAACPGRSARRRWSASRRGCRSSRRRTG